MAKKGQISLEAVVLLLILISLFAQVTLPLTFWGSATGKATAAVSTAVDSVNNFADAVNLVGVSGDGARKILRLTVPIQTTNMGITCTDVSITSNFRSFGSDAEWPQIEKDPDRPTLVYTEGTEYQRLYRREVDFKISNYEACVENTKDFEDVGGTVYVCIENVDGEIVLEFIDNPISNSCTWS